jgi:DNA-directed RNA polymerase subunit F
LEHKGLLEVAITGPLGDILRPQRTASSPIKSVVQENDTLTFIHLQQLSAIYLAACCLYHLQKYEDCLQILDNLVHLEDHMRERVAIRTLSLLPNQASEINIISGL